MKKFKPLVFICAGLMTIATLYGAIDLAKSNSKEELKDLYVEKTEEERPTKTIEEDKVEIALPEIEEKVTVKKEEKVAPKREAKKSKKKISEIIEPEVYNNPIEEAVEVKKKKELEWESFSRKAVDRKFKKTKVITDSVQQVQ